MNSGIFKSMILLSMFLATSSIEAEEIDNKNANVSVINSDYVQSASVNGWSSQGGKWSYYKDGVLQKNWQLIDGRWFYLGTDGFMQIGWQSIGGKWYYLNPNSDGSQGAMMRDWQHINDKWYYLDSYTGDMLTDWALLNDGKDYYYLGTDGAMRMGWQSIGDKWYYLERDLGGSEGIMKKDWQLVDGKWYFLYATGEMATGWEEINSKWYYFYENGEMAKDTVIDGWKVGADGVGIQNAYKANSFSLGSQQVAQYSDGSLQGVKNVNSLTDNQLDTYLLKMGFGESEIKTINSDLKKTIVKDGGIKEGTVVSSKEIYTSLDNKSYEVTDENRDEINAIKKYDMMKSPQKSVVSYSYGQPSVTVKDDLVFNVFVIRQGTKRNDYVYNFYTNQFWTKSPYMKTKDVLSIGWDSSKVSRVAGRSHARQDYFFEGWVKGKWGNYELEKQLSPDISSLAGNKWSSYSHAGASGIYSVQQVTIPKSHNGTNMTISAGFVHPYLQSAVSVNIGPLGSISFDGLGEKHYLDYSFYIGDRM